MVQTRHMTADDLLALGSDCHCELVEGELVEMSPTGPEHGEVSGISSLIIGGFIRSHRLGRFYGAETGFRLRRDPDTIRAPDFAFVAAGRITADMDPTRYFDLAPDLVVEVVSPHDRASEVAKKVGEYLAAGVRLIWVAYPQIPAIAVHRPGVAMRMLLSGDELSGEDVLPGFSCRVVELFPEPLP
jgi:Uma2 family endonuclease